VRLDGLLAEEQPGRDLGIRPAVDDEPCNLKLTLRQRREARSVGRSCPRAPVRAAAEHAVAFDAPTALVELIAAEAEAPAHEVVLR
jgi:hypothetical protein